MLQTIREHTQGWIAGTIISIIILTFALWGIHSYFIGGGARPNVAEVNGVEITREQLQVSYERLRRQVQRAPASSGMAVQDEVSLKNRALQSLVNMEVLRQASIAQGFLVSDRQINIYLQGMPEFQVGGQFSLDRFQEILSSSMLSTSEFLELIRTNLLIDQPRSGLIFSSFSLPDETDSIISLVNQERNIDYIAIPAQFFLSQPIVISAAKISEYYNQNKQDFMTPEQVSVEYIELSLKALFRNFNPTENMLKNFYNENMNSYVQPAQWKIASIEFPVPATASQDDMKQVVKNGELALGALRKGGDIASIANQYGGHLANTTWISPQDAPAELQKPMSQLAKAGDVSQPFKIANALVLIKLVEIQDICCRHEHDAG